MEGNILIDSDTKEYYKDLEGKGIVLTLGQRNWYYLKKRDLGDQIYSEYPSTFDEAFNLTIK